MKTNLTKYIWITGASSGIGAALAVQWAGENTFLILSARNVDKLKEVGKQCEVKGSKCLIAPFDLSNPQEIQKEAEKVLREVPRIDILVNNGGISQRSLAIDTPVEIDRMIIETNFFASVQLTKLVLPLMKNQGEGHIVAISSVVGKFGFPLRSAYSASKHALQGFFESLRAELKGMNIHVTIISPGRIFTNISINAINQNGQKHGMMDPGQSKGIPADRCAEIIKLGVEKKRKEILIGRGEVALVFIRKFMPFLYYKLVPSLKTT